jgi:hypothetical protein
MEPAKATWTDQRFDDMSGRVDALGRRMDDGFNRVDADIRALRAETNARFDAAEARADSRFEAMQARTDAFQRTMLQLGGGMMVTFVVGFASILLAQLA